METTLAEKLLKAGLADNFVPGLWILCEELLSPRTTGDETSNNLFGEIVCI